MATEKKTAPKGEKQKSAVKATATKKTADAAVSNEGPLASSHKPAELQTGLDHRKVAVGYVVSDKMQKTIVVKVDRRVRHSLYKKYVKKSRRFKAHDEKNEARIGDLVTIVESRPLSRDKRWALQKIVRRAEVTLEANV